MGPVAAVSFDEHGVEPGLLLGPPGCGKTEQIARWVASLSARGLVRPPMRVLGLTFSNKAKANLRARLQHHLGLRWYRHALVTNFHGFAFRVYQHHASAVGRQPVEIAPQRGWLRALLNRVVNSTKCDRDELCAVLRSAKVGPFDDDEVLQRLDAAGFAPAVKYEQSLRANGRVDFDDVMRLGHLVLRCHEVADLYRTAFAAMVVDEVQDLSLGQLELARVIGEGRTVYAGDLTQGIYGFAGAEPAGVLARIRDECPREYEVDESFRSSPAVLRAVSRVREALGGGPISCAVPEEWTGKGSVRLLRSRDTKQEAENVREIVTAWSGKFPGDSIAVITRSGPRRRAIDGAFAAGEVPAEKWDFPVHQPLIAGLLARHVDVAALAGDHQAMMQELYNSCLVDIDPTDLDALDELQDACEAIEDLYREGYELPDIVGGIRISSDPDAPVGPGLHLLNGHVGKGQQFDHVVVAGLEEAILPNYAAMLTANRGDSSQIVEELAVLHVMVSRAREDLVITVADSVPNWKGVDQQRTPSRFLQLVESAVDEVLDLR